MIETSAGHLGLTQMELISIFVFDEFEFRTNLRKRSGREGRLLLAGKNLME